jgi:hypothetical protein
VLGEVAKFEESPAGSEPLILYTDETADSEKTYFYRIKGMNVAGDSGYSGVVKVQK